MRPSSETKHSRLEFENPHTCAAQGCSRTFDNGNELEKHAKKAKHKAFQCNCDPSKAYTKLCSLTRHIEGETKPGRFECPLGTHKAPAWSDGKVPCFSFRRIGHLEQHLRSWHHGKTRDEVKALVAPLRKRKAKVLVAPLRKRKVATSASMNDATTVGGPNHHQNAFGSMCNGHGAPVSAPGYPTAPIDNFPAFVNDVPGAPSAAWDRSRSLLRPRRSSGPMACHPATQWTTSPYKTPRCLDIRVSTQPSAPTKLASRVHSRVATTGPPPTSTQTR